MCWRVPHFGVSIVFVGLLRLLDLTHLRADTVRWCEAKRTSLAESLRGFRITFHFPDARVPPRAVV